MTETMPAIVLWQPWASLVAIGAKPVEYRRWDYRKRTQVRPGERIAIIAGARPVRPREVHDLIRRCEGDEPPLIVADAIPLLRKLVIGQPIVPMGLPLGCLVCTAIIGEPFPVAAIAFPDSDRIAHHAFGWPLSAVEACEPLPVRGRQGFFRIPIPERACTFA